MRNKMMKYGSVLVMAVLLLMSRNSVIAQEYNNKDVKSDNQEDVYKKKAQQMTSRLSQKINLSKDQSEKIGDILVDFQKDVAEDTRTGDKSDVTGSANSLQDDLKKADISANDKIEKILPENQISAYMKVKKEWWAKIKDKVYSKDFIRNEEQASRSDNDNDRSARKTDKNKDKSDMVGSSRDEKDNSEYGQFAKEMAVNLMNQLNISLDKASDVQDALMDYEKSVADAQSRYFSQANRENVAVTDRESRRTGDVRQDRTRVDKDNMVGSSRSNEYNAKIQDAMKSADDKIVDVLRDNQKQQYAKVKNQWWKDVVAKAETHSAKKR